MDKIMTLRGVKPKIQPLGVRDGPKLGGCGVFPYIRACLALISQLLRGHVQVPLKSPPSVKKAESSLARGHIRGGGGGLGVTRVGTRDHRRGLGGPYTRKKFFGLQVQIHTQRPQYGKEF